MKGAGHEISQYALDQAMPSVKPYITHGRFTQLPYKDKEFDFVIAVGVVYCLTLADAIACLREIQRVGKGKSFITLGAYKDARGERLFKKWSVLGATILHVDEWVEVLKEAGYTGDYSFTSAESLNLVEMPNRTMKAAIMIEQKKPLVVDMVHFSDELEYGQVLVKMSYASICGSQVNEILGLPGPDKYLPHLMGHEGSGVVEKCGAGVTTVKPGDSVVLHWRKGNGLQSATPKYLWNGKAVNAGAVTSFNEFAVVSENRVTPVPKDTDLKTAVLYGCALTTGFGIVNHEARVKSGESVVVLGAGGVGLSVILAASIANACPIVAVDISEQKLKKALEFGATHVIDSSKEDVRTKVRELFKGGADVVVETVGLNAVKETAYELTSSNGRTVLVGITKAGDKMQLDTTPLHFGKSIVPSYGGSSNPSYDIPRLVRLQQSGKINLNSMLTHEFTLDEINKAMEAMQDGKTLRCLIKLQ